MPESDEPVGTLAEEAAKLVAAMISPGAPRNVEIDADAAEAAASGDHRCPHGWCPLCQVVEYVQDHPEIVAEVVLAGAEFLKVVRDAVDVFTANQRSEDEPQ